MSSLNGYHRDFRASVEAIAALDPGVVQQDAILAVGLLIGAGFPAAAAACAHAAQIAHPDRAQWPWSPDPKET